MDYEVEVSHEGHDYMVYADLYEDGSYSWGKDGAGREWLDVSYEPRFGDWVVYRYDDNNDLIELKAWDVEVRNKAEHIMRQIYWDRVE